MDNAKITKKICNFLTNKPTRWNHLFDENNSVAVADLCQIDRFAHKNVTLEQLQTAILTNNLLSLVDGRVSLA